jgi:hypothetical protein
LEGSGGYALECPDILRLQWIRIPSTPRLEVFTIYREEKTSKESTIFLSYVKPLVAVAQSQIRDKSPVQRKYGRTFLARHPYLSPTLSSFFVSSYPGPILGLTNTQCQYGCYSYGLYEKGVKDLHIVMLRQFREILIQFLNTLLMRLYAFLMETII